MWKIFELTQIMAQFAANYVRSEIENLRRASGFVNTNEEQTHDRRRAMFGMATGGMLGIKKENKDEIAPTAEDVSLFVRSIKLNEIFSLQEKIKNLQEFGTTGGQYTNRIICWSDFVTIGSDDRKNREDPLTPETLRNKIGQLKRLVGKHSYATKEACPELEPLIGPVLDMHSLEKFEQNTRNIHEELAQTLYQKLPDFLKRHFDFAKIRDLICSERTLTFGQIPWGEKDSEEYKKITRTDEEINILEVLQKFDSNGNFTQEFRGSKPLVVNEKDFIKLGFPDNPFELQDAAVKHVNALQEAEYLEAVQKQREEWQKQYNANQLNSKKVDRDSKRARRADRKANNDLIDKIIGGEPTNNVQVQQLLNDLRSIFGEDVEFRSDYDEKPNPRAVSALYLCIPLGGKNIEDYKKFVKAIDDNLGSFYARDAYDERLAMGEKVIRTLPKAIHVPTQPYMIIPLGPFLNSIGHGDPIRRIVEFKDHPTNRLYSAIDQLNNKDYTREGVIR